VSGSDTTSFLRRNLRWIAPVCALVVAGAVCGFVLLCRACREPEIAFDGDSTALQRTVIVPTLDTPIPEGKNVIWCASFQVAWNRLKNDVIKEPIRIENAEEVCERLNAAPQSEADLPEGSYYAAAGFVKDGILDTIRTEMAARFPHVTPHEFGPLDVIVAYAYLAANVKFTMPFFQNDEDLVFTGAAGDRASVDSFGIRPEDRYVYEELRKQVRNVYFKHPDRNVPGSRLEFAVDPCVTSTPNQILLACIEPKGTLAETLAYLEKGIAAFEAESADWLKEFGLSQSLLVPNVFWEIKHRFDEIEGVDKIVMNQVGRGLYVREAFQMIRFRLDRSGAELASEASIALGCAGPPDAVFDRPFLIVMRRRGAEHPFFVMWVDNAELLCRR
jgi:hypothetical protein